MQIDQPARGFSYMQEGPLDMRMNASSGESARDLIGRLDTAALAGRLREWGEVKRPRRLARSILAARDAGELEGTGDLRRAVERVIGPRDFMGELSRVFQALRIGVNAELEQLERILAELPDLLGPGGVALVLSYHSLEDRPVKRAFAAGARGCVCPPELPVCGCGRRAHYELLTPRALRPGNAEIARNPRARSARLRAVRRCAC